MNAFEKWSVWITSALTGATGVGYFWTKYLIQSPDPFAVVNHPLQPWFLKAHIVVSPFLLLAVGMILVRHVWKHLRLGVAWARKSGLLTGGVLLPMVVTGYLIQAVTAQGWLKALVYAHLITGFAYLAGLGLHHVAVVFLRPTAKCRREPEECRRSSKQCREHPEECGIEGLSEDEAGEGAGALVSIRPSREAPGPSAADGTREGASGTARPRRTDPRPKSSAPSG